MPNQYFIETQRLTLRPFEVSDVARIVEIFANPNVAKWVDDGKPLSAERAKKWVAVSYDSVQKNGSSAGALIEKSTGRMVGWGGIVHAPDDLPEIIYGFEEQVWGKGYGKEIAKAIVEDGTDIRAFKQIIATVDPENAASVHILKSLSFRLIESGLDEHGLPTDTYQLG